MLILLVAVYIASRAVLIVYGGPHICHPYFDEPVSGTLTYDLLHGGLRAPLMAYQYEQRSGDMMIEALVMYPLAALFGHTLLTIKLCALLCSLACMLGWLYLIHRYCGMTAAIVFALLFALPPPMFARLSLVGTFSSHHMINTILVVQLICLFRMFERDERTVPLLLWLVFGLCAGLGVYASYSYLIFDALCGLFILECRPRMITLRSACVVSAGALAGFFPWLWRSVFYTSGGGSFLMGIFKNITLSPWLFVQTFFHTLPYTLGYGYPTRAIGWPGVVLALVLLGTVVVIVRAALRSPPGIGAGTPCAGVQGTAVPARFCFFVALFPVFYLVCLTLSPMQVGPLEYWPTIGIFATFPPADVIRCRWVTVLFPFYFACAGIALAMVAARRAAVLRTIAWVCVLLVAALNCARIADMLARDNKNMLLLYQGYNFDQHARRLLLARRGEQGLGAAEALVSSYPQAYREEAVRALGTRLAFDAACRQDADERIVRYVAAVPDAWRSPLMYGVLRVLHGSPEKASAPWVRAIAARYPVVFYAHWGTQVLGYRYYGFMLNRSKLLENIPVSERFFFGAFLEIFRNGLRDEYHSQFVDRMSAYDDRTVERMFMQDIAAVPAVFRCSTVQGIGRLVGAEMLFDTLHMPDYPLDSSIGDRLPDRLASCFYRGVGNGFAETLCRYWRRLMPPDATSCDRYARGLDIEWQRCISLMRQLPPGRRDLIWEGFLQELGARPLNESITAFITRKRSML